MGRGRRGCASVACVGTETEPLHILVTIDRDGVSHVESVDTLNGAQRVRGVNAPDIGGVAGLGEVRLHSLRLRPIVAQYASPFLDRLVVVRRVQGRVNRAVVDLETRAGARVARVHVLYNVGPVCGGGIDVAARTGGVPSVDLVGRRHEAAGRNPGVGGRRLEELRVGSSHDVL